MPVKLHFIEATDAGAVDVLRQVVFGAPACAIACDGRAPTEDHVRELIESRPPGAARIKSAGSALTSMETRWAASVWCAAGRSPTRRRSA